MEIATVTFRLHAPWVQSLKEKRMIVKSIISKIENQFRVSVVPNQAYADSMMDEISKFLEEITDAEILDETREMR